MELPLYDQMSQLETVHFWFRARQRILKELLKKKLSPDDLGRLNILDVGCGTGGNLAWLKEFGDVFAFDHEKTACKIAQAKQPGKVVCASLDSALPFKRKTFDFIACLDVLEHLDDEAGALRKFKEIIKDSGKIMLTVPAFLHLWSHHDVVHHHRRRYRSEQLREVLRDSGFDVIYISYFNTFLYPLIAGTRFIKKAFKAEQEDLRLPSPLLNECLYRIFAAERHWIGNGTAPFGVSLVAIASPAG